MFGQVYFSSFTTRSRGAILIRRTLPFKMVKCLKDKNGCYVIVKGSLQGQEILIMNVYYPPSHPLDFITKVFVDLAEMRADTVIVGGDFNCMLNPLIDRFPHSAKAPSPQAKALTAICNDLGFDDVWRSLHPANKEYTFFSAPHGCQTRIYYFFRPRAQLQLFLTCLIGNIVISVHASVVMDIKLPVPSYQSRQWRLNTVILKDNTFTSYFSTEFKAFLSINSQSTDNPSLLWETCKAYARGQIISFSATKRRQNLERQRSLEAKLSDKEKAYQLLFCGKKYLLSDQL